MACIDIGQPDGHAVGIMNEMFAAVAVLLKQSYCSHLRKGRDELVGMNHRTRKRLPPQIPESRGLRMFLPQ